MGYRLAEQNGESVAVPRLVFAHLARADGDTIRAALYLLGGGGTDPRTMARDLGMPSIEAAKRAMQYWAGAGLLISERGAAPAPAAEPARVDLASVANDPYVAVLCQEAQSIFGKTLSRSEMQRLVGLYLNDGWQPDVILLCCAEVTRLGRRTIAAVTHLLARWREDGVETGEDAERWLQRAKQREAWCQDAAAQFGIEPRALTNWERRTIARWHEEMGIGREMIDEALLRANGKNTVRYVDGILRAWRAQGITTIDAARRQGQLEGSNIVMTERPNAQPPAASGLFVKIATASAAAVGSSVHRNNSDGGRWSIAAACSRACNAERVLPSQNPPPSTPPEDRPVAEARPVARIIAVKGSSHPRMGDHLSPAGRPSARCWGSNTATGPIFCRARSVAVRLSGRVDVVTTAPGASKMALMTMWAPFPERGGPISRIESSTDAQTFVPRLAPSR